MMRSGAYLSGVILSLGILTLSGCATANGPQGAVKSPADPLAAINRPMFHLNMGLYDYVLEPVTTGYKAVTPDFVRGRFHSALRPICRGTARQGQYTKGQYHS